MKTKIDLPSEEKLLAGLSLHELHPAFARAEQDLAKAEQNLLDARTKLARQERMVSELPARITRGEEKASALTSALREREAAALMIQAATDAVERARQKVPAEERLARAALDREVDKRSEQLARASRDIAPLLQRRHSLSLALSRVLSSGCAGFFSVNWPCSSHCHYNRHESLIARTSFPSTEEAHAAMQSSAPASSK